MTDRIVRVIKPLQMCKEEELIWLPGTLTLLSKCDLMIVLTDSENSTGTQGEIKFARKNNIPYRILKSDANLLREIHEILDEFLKTKERFRLYFKKV